MRDQPDLCSAVNVNASAEIIRSEHIVTGDMDEKAPVKSTESSKRGAVDGVAVGIELKDVTFTYPGAEDPAIRNLSMTIVPPDLRDLEKKIEEVITEKETSIAAQEFEKAAAFRDEEKELKKELQTLKQSWDSDSTQPQTKVDTKLVCNVIASITGIPVAEVEEEETDKLLRMEDEMRKWIIGQDEALEAVSKAIRKGIV